MQILLGFIIGALIGAAVHFTVQGRGARGVVLAPVLGAFVAGLVWMTLTWVGLGIDNPWLWVSAFVAPIVVVYPAVVLLTRGRQAHDESEKVRLKIA